MQRHYEQVTDLDILAQLRPGGILNGENLRNANLFGLNLAGINLSDADLTGANLSTADLTGANLEFAYLNDADLRGAILTNSNLRNANLFRTDLRGAILEDIDFEDVDMDDVVQGQLLEPILPPLLEVEGAIVAPEIQGRAFEVHNYFDALNIVEITSFIQEFNSSNMGFNERTISRLVASQEESLFTPLLNFIDNSDLFIPSEKENNKEKLNRILSIAQEYDGFNANINLLNATIEFVSKQNDDFIEQYIRIIKDECLNAYGQGSESCVKGMFERIITTLGSVAITLTKDNLRNQENETYKRLKQFFLNFSELVQEWASIYLEDGEKNDELKELNIAERKSHFINFMITKYGASITPYINRKILEEAEEYQSNGLFQRMTFGGKKIKKKKTIKKRKNVIKKNTKKNKQRKNTKKNIKKKFKKIKNTKKR
jgi:uncharacterized protein YjbI with pentapeptide repeats